MRNRESEMRIKRIVLNFTIYNLQFSIFNQCLFGKET